MPLRLYNTLTRRLETFEPIEPGHVRMYVCGITVYDLCHMGHARMNMAFDVVYRWLRASGYRVTYVRNITDIEDKIIRRALERGITIRALTDEMIAAMHRDFAALGLELPSAEPRATDYVPQMLDLISQLEHKGLAYRAAGGDVNYAVRRFDGYGKLSGKSLDELRAGERVAVLGDKEDPLDFVLWKSAKPDEPADAIWASDFDIFSLSMFRKPLCSQYFAKPGPLAPTLWAISFSWCGNSRSMPPPWMSKVSPNSSQLMAEHSMCQPGRPAP